VSFAPLISTAPAGPLFPSGHAGAAAPNLRIAAPPDDPQINSPVRRAAFYAALIVIFLRYSMLHEVLSYYVGGNSAVLYVFSIPALLGAAATGGFQRCFSSRPMLYWAGFISWLWLAVPFSVWRGESAKYAFAYLRTDLPMIFLFAGLIITWKECRTALFTIAFAAMVNIASAPLFGKFYGSGRAGLQFSTIANPNDFAAHLILILPVLAFVICYPMRMPLVGVLARWVGSAALVYGLYLVVASGSRGALLALLTAVGYVFLKSHMPARVAILFGLPAAGVLLVMVLPAHTIERLQSYSTSIKAYDDEAGESAFQRNQLLRESIEATLAHPLLGVGPGTFGDYAGKMGSAARWINPHNSYTQVSSENGIPGLLFYLAGIVSPFLLIQRSWKRVRNDLELAEIATACFCLSVGVVGFCAAILFVNFAYFFYLPAFAGLAIAMGGAVNREIALRKAAPKPVPVVAKPLLPRTIPGFSAMPPSPPAEAPRNRFRFGGYR
jgi:O-antigen ligase